MSIHYYLVPMSAPPYSRENPQRPLYMDDIRCNWTGHPLNGLGYYVCLVNTTDAKHSELANQPGVQRLPGNWNTPVLSLSTPLQNTINRWCNNHNIPYDPNETIGELIERIIASAVLGLQGYQLSTPFSLLPAYKRKQIIAFCQQSKFAIPNDNETMSTLLHRSGRDIWPGNDPKRVYVEEG